MSRLASLEPSHCGAAVGMEKRASVRHICTVEATSHPLDTGDAICWGATVRDISTGGLSLSLCFPFKLGTHLAVDLQGVNGLSRTLLTRVTHVHDQADGTWLLGCEFIKPLSGTELEILI
jgi:hypothetical protein